MKTLVVAALVIFAQNAAHAATPAAAAPAAPAEQCSTGQEADQISCLTALYANTEETLNTTYRARLKALSDREQFDATQAAYYENLKDIVTVSERAWFIYRENQCNLESMMAMKAEFTIPTKMRCAIRLDNERVSFLNKFTISVRK